MSLVALTTAMLMPAQASSQVKKTSYGGSTCSTDNVKSGSSKGRLSANGSAYVQIPASGSYARINNASGRVDNTSCRNDNGIAMTSLNVKVVIKVTTVKADTCSVGFPSGVTCTASGSTVTLTLSKSCKNVSKCSKDWGTEWFIDPKSAAGKITRVSLQAIYTGKQSGKDRIEPGTTKSVTWHPGT